MDEFIEENKNITDIADLTFEYNEMEINALKQIAHMRSDFKVRSNFRESNISNTLGLLKEDVGNNISNAHFTPIGIFLKFGFLGFISWTTLLSKIIFKIFHRNEFYFVKVSLLAIIGFIFQSLFAFGFFINLFTPFLIGLCLAKLEKEN